jgi:hypothetical protein
MVGISVIIVEKIIPKKYEAVLKVQLEIQIGSPKFPENTFQKHPLEEMTKIPIIIFHIYNSNLTTK